MATFKFNRKKLDNAIGLALLDTVQLVQQRIKDVTPRDPQRLPQDPSRKVTGNLKRSIVFEQTWKFSYVVGSAQNTASYWKYLEFGTPYMEARPFITKWAFENTEEFKENFIKVFKNQIKK